MALRVPKPLAEDAGLGEDSVVELSTHEGKLVIELTAALRYDLDELLAAINEENLHGEVETGTAMVREVW